MPDAPRALRPGGGPSPPAWGPCARRRGQGRADGAARSRREGRRARARVARTWLDRGRGGGGAASVDPQAGRAEAGRRCFRSAGAGCVFGRSSHRQLPGGAGPGSRRYNCGPARRVVRAGARLRRGAGRAGVRRGWAGGLTLGVWVLAGRGAGR